MVGLSIGSLPIQRMSNKQKPQKRPMRGRDWTLLASVDWSKQWKTLCLKNWNLQCRWRRVCSSVQLFEGKFGNLVPHRVYCFLVISRPTWNDLEESWSNLNQIRCFEIMSTCLPRLWGLQQGLGARVVLSKALYVLAFCIRLQRLDECEVWKKCENSAGTSLVEKNAVLSERRLWYHRVILIQSSLHFFQKIEMMQIMLSRIMSYFPESPTSSSNVQEILDLIGQDGWSLIEESSGIQRDTNLQNFRHWFD